MVFVAFRKDAWADSCYQANWSSRKSCQQGLASLIPFEVEFMLRNNIVEFICISLDLLTNGLNKVL